MEQPSIKPVEEMDFRELGAEITERGNISTTTLNRFLEIGTSHWKQQAEQGGIFTEYYGRLAKRYQEAFGGTNENKRAFCQEEATYLLELADETAGLGDQKGAEQLQKKAQNWINTAMNICFTG